MAAAVSQQKCRLDVPGRYIYYDPALGALIEDAASGLRHCGVQLFGSHYLNRNRLGGVELPLPPTTCTFGVNFMRLSVPALLSQSRLGAFRYTFFCYC